MNIPELFIIEGSFNDWVALLKFAGKPPIILIKIIIEDPFPNFSLVISSANHDDSIDPVVKDKITFNARLKFN